jgi:hypothetical protein
MLRQLVYGSLIMFILLVAGAFSIWEAELERQENLTYIKIGLSDIWLTMCKTTFENEKLKAQLNKGVK